METQNNNNNITTTNQLTSTSEQRTNTTISPPVTRASSVIREQTTATTGLPRRRIKWTQDMNMSVLKAYFKAKRAENQTGYRQQMYTLFLSEYPELSHLTQQNIADRRAAIIRNNLIPVTVQEEIRQTVERESQHDSTPQIPPSSIVPNVTPTYPDTINTIPENTILSDTPHRSP